MNKLKLMIDQTKKTNTSWVKVAAIYAKNMDAPLVLVTDFEEADGLLVVADSKDIIPPAMALSSRKDLPIVFLDPVNSIFEVITDFVLPSGGMPGIVRELFNAS